MRLHREIHIRGGNHDVCVCMFRIKSAPFTGLCDSDHERKSAETMWDALVWPDCIRINIRSHSKGCNCGGNCDVCFCMSGVHLIPVAEL